MDSMPKEGAARPLYSSAPDYTQNYLTAKPKERWTPPRGFVLTAVCSYLPAYLYTRYILFGATKDRWTMLLFAVVYLIGVELLSRSQKRPDSAESGFWMVCWLVQSAALMIFPDHAGSIYLLQWLAWHATAVYWTMCRTGMLCAGQSGLWTPVDLLMGVTVLPWRDFLLRARTLAHGGSNVLRRVGGDRRRALGGAFSAVMALAVCVFAWSQLAGVDETFARLGQGLFGWLDGLLSPDTVLIFVLSLPVGAWLFGLIGGGLRRREAPLTAQALDRGLASLPRLPVSTGYLVPGALCGVYGLFFAVQAYEFFTAAGQGLTAQAASDFAVTGFWELCRILLLDFVVLTALFALHLVGVKQAGVRRVRLPVCRAGSRQAGNVYPPLRPHAPAGAVRVVFGRAAGVVRAGGSVADAPRPGRPHRGAGSGGQFQYAVLRRHRGILRPGKHRPLSGRGHRYGGHRPAGPVRRAV